MSELIRRAAPGLAIAGVALGTVWMFDPALHAATVTSKAAQGSDADSGTDSDPDTDTGASTESDTSTGSEPGTSTDSGTATDSSDCSTASSVTGEAAMTRWGPVQVQMAFAADGTVCSVQAIAYPDDDPRSSRINAMAIPYLDQQAAEVGTSFDAVSGATYTSEAYRASMQSILDQR